MDAALDVCIDMYAMLFNGITDALELLEAGNVTEAKRVLVESQQNAEDIYMKADVEFF